MGEIQGYRAHIKNGDEVVEVSDGQPEIFVAKVLEATERLSKPEKPARAIGLRVEAIPRTEEAVGSITASVRGAIEKFVDGAKSHLELRDAYLERFGADLGQAAIASWERQAALDPEREMARLQTLSGASGVTILEGASANWGQELQDRLRDIGVLSVGKSTPPLDAETLKLRFGDMISDAAFHQLAEKYTTLPDLSDVVEDANIRRLCSALTASGFETRYSCEGHGYELAHIKFVCSTEQRDALQELLNASKAMLNEEWTLVEDHMDHRTLRYRLEPKYQNSRSTRHNRIIADLDVIGMLVLQKFSSKNSEG